MQWILFFVIAPLFALVDRAPEKSFLRRLGKLPLILFWLAIEYLFHTPFLGEIFLSKPEWIRWATFTGYSGVSLWILLANLFLYLGLFQKWPYTVVFVIVIVGPILYSYTLQSDYVARLTMLLLYMNDPSPTEGYNARGEWIPRTAAWISVLILASVIVKANIRKK